MKRPVIALVLVALCLSIALPALAQMEQTKVKFGEYYVIYAERGPTWKPQTDEKGMEVRMQVLAALKKQLLENHSVIIAGLVTDGSSAEFIIVAQTDDEMGLRKFLNDAPNVANGFYNVKVHCFSGPAGLKLETVPR